MKKFFTRLVEFFEDIGRARAAATLARAGKYKEAQSLYRPKAEFDVHP